MTGYNATELFRYSNYPKRRRGECHGVSAANRLEQLIGQPPGPARRPAGVEPR